MLSPGELVQSARFAPMLLAGASDRVEEGWFRARNRTGERAPQSGVDMRAQAQDAVQAGLGFLARAQREDGLWRGFMLAPGASTEWITAHVALLLEDIPEARAMRERAARGLFASTRGRPGWGYNHRVGIDSDSTAQAIMVLHGLGHAIEEAWVEQLLATHREEGGFGTYATTRPDGQARTWWEMPHADVTLIVVEALARLDRCAEERALASAWLEQRAARRRAAGVLVDEPRLLAVGAGARRLSRRRELRRRPAAAPRRAALDLPGDADGSRARRRRLVAAPRERRREARARAPRGRLVAVRAVPAQHLRRPPRRLRSPGPDLRRPLPRDLDRARRRRARARGAGDALALLRRTLGQSTVPSLRMARYSS